MPYQHRRRTNKRHRNDTHVPTQTRLKTTVEKQNQAGFKLYPDGVRFGKVTLRLSNVPGNLSRQASHVGSLFTGVLSGVATIGNRFVSGSTYFYSKEPDIVGYSLAVIDTSVPEINSVISDINNGTCNVNTNVTHIPIDFDLIQKWASDSSGELLSFWRETGKAANEAVEKCIESLVQTAVDTYEAEQEEESTKTTIMIMTALGAVAGAAALVFAAHYARKKILQYRATRQAAQDEEQQPLIQEEQVAPAENSVNSEAPAAEINTNNVSDEPRQPKTIADRIKTLETEGYDLYKFITKGSPAENYLCPILKEIMDDPVIANDGHTYERTVIEGLIERGQKSPFNRNITLKGDAQPNFALKGCIDAFIQEHERVHEQQKKEKLKQAREKADAILKNQYPKLFNHFEGHKQSSKSKQNGKNDDRDFLRQSI